MRIILCLLILVAGGFGTALAEVLELPAERVVIRHNPSRTSETVAAVYFRLPSRLQRRPIEAAHLYWELDVHTASAEDSIGVRIAYRPLFGSWDETARWEDFGPMSGPPSQEVWMTEPGAKGPIRLDLTDQVREWTATRMPNFGVAVVARGSVLGFDVARNAKGKDILPTLKIWINPFR